jgi:hypothetical protein
MGSFDLQLWMCIGAMNRGKNVGNDRLAWLNTGWFLSPAVSDNLPFDERAC